ncbi:ArsR/SmtB family transcription factor [Brachybacterium phenoliresistens]|uniref:ArsR/SmtB family transcription factor n=1 Tax=Brachybacterium phenoliresistens TaxID=396014 RepID=UPI0009FE82BD|nr:metalloregulator ArsR/SmtB family transcription factor [Brachybacterium phenoliresistens]
MNISSYDGGGGPAPVLPADPAVRDAADVFSLLGDPGRLRLLLALRAGEHSVHELAELSAQSDSAASHALKLLRAHRVVSARREGRRVHYALADPHVRTLLDVALAHIEHAVPQHGATPHDEGRHAERAHAPAAAGDAPRPGAEAVR